MHFEVERSDLSAASMEADQLLDILRTSKSDKNLRSFFRHPDFLEVLLIIIKLDGDPRFGLGSYIEMINKRSISHLSVANFIRDEIESGRLLISEGNKKSRKTLVASESTLSALARLFNGMNFPQDKIA